MDRRGFLAVLTAGFAAPALAGCLDPPQDGDQSSFHLEITVQNDHDRPYDAHVVVNNETDEVVLENAFTIQPGTGRGFSDDLTGGTYTIEVRLDGHLALRSFWETDTCDVHQSRVGIGADGRGTSAVRCADATTTTEHR